MTGIFMMSSGGAGAQVLAPSASVYDVGTSPLAAYRLVSATGRSQTKVGIAAFVDHGVWLSPATAPGDYEARMTVNSGSGLGVFTGTVDAWIDLASDQTWQISTSGTSNIQFRYMTLEIRAKATPDVILATGGVNLTAEVPEEPL